MPEGHTIHRLAGVFNERFAGRTVDASSPQGRMADGAALLDGRVLEAAEAQGKQMFLRFSGDHWLRVHLGLYGMWRFAGAGLAGYGRRTRKVADAEPAWPPPPLGQVRLRLVAGRRVADLSGPTACAVIDPGQKQAAQATMGDDPMRPDADPARAVARLRASRSAIGLLLMRQDIVAGIGNIFRAELLFRARIEPHRPGRDLTQAQAQGLWDDFAALLPPCIADGHIVTTRPEDRPKRRATAKPAAVKRGDASYVAHRAGKPCRVCGTPVSAEDMAGRRLYWCATCQTE